MAVSDMDGDGMVAGVFAYVETTEPLTSLVAEGGRITVKLRA
ncbi:hypothetical protein ACP70R_000585 [Stipagrostis hirtigluma subsp. patula]